MYRTSSASPTKTDPPCSRGSANSTSTRSPAVSRTDSPVTTYLADGLEAGIAAAAELLRAGKLVALPTETVYGLAADASDDRAVASIYAAKERPSFNPLIAHRRRPNIGSSSAERRALGLNCERDTARTPDAGPRRLRR